MPAAVGALLLTSAFGTAAATFTIGATGILLAEVVGYAVLTAATVGAQLAAQAILSKTETAVKPAENQFNIKQAIVSRRRSYGEVKIGGVIAFEEVDVNVTAGLFVVLLQGQGQIDSVIEHWLGDDPLLLNPSTGLSEGIFNFGGVFIKNYLGEDNQTTPPDLLTSFDNQYSSDHRWRGVPLTLIRYVKPVDLASAQIIYPYGPQAYRCVQKAAKLYDPRDVGQDADGSPDLPDDNDWVWSDNASLVILDFLRHPDGFAARSDREMVPISQFHLPDWEHFADLCDQGVDRADGSPPIARYRIWGTYDLTATPKTILQGMLDSCDAELYRTGTGLIGIRGGEWTAPTVTITDADILSHSMRRGSRTYSACNIIRAKYISKPHDYQQQDMEPWIDQANIDSRRQELPVELDFSWVSNHSQARRLAKIQMAKRNPDWTGTIITNVRGLLAFNQRIITVEIEELGINRPFLVIGFRPSNSLSSVELIISSIESSAYDWDPETEEGFGPAISMTTIDGTSDIVPTSPSATGSAMSGAFQEVSFDWTNVSGYRLYYEAQYAEGDLTSEGGSGAAYTADWIGLQVPEDLTEITPVVLAEGFTYTFRVRSILPTGRGSHWAYDTITI